MTSNEKMCDLDTLKNLLEQLIEMLRKSNFQAVESIAQKTQTLVWEIVENKMFEKPHFTEKRMEIIKLYKSIELILEADKDSISKQLKQVVAGRKTLRKYRNNSYIPAFSFENI
jgi:hypothetical protein